VGLLEPRSLTKIANALERLVALYTLDLKSRGFELEPPDRGEGEVLVTDDEEVSNRIERAKAFSGIPRPGFYVGEEPEGILDAQGRPRGEEVQVNFDTSRSDSPVLGSGWGLNVGPEGAEENRAGPDGDRRS
jgi:hypothetical protein